MDYTSIYFFTMDEFKKNYHFEHRDKKLCQKTYRRIRNL